MSRFHISSSKYRWSVGGKKFQLEKIVINNSRLERHKDDECEQRCCLHQKIIIMYSGEAADPLRIS